MLKNVKNSQKHPKIGVFKPKTLKNDKIWFPKSSQTEQKRVKPEDFTLILVPLTGVEPVRKVNFDGF